ncbi:MAG: hypothetical protein IIY21_19130 [Clostridiales bacterium]|nr:hypothetical protein [Clostridiales bacterium]MBQ1572893.1 hypothetical protein [Clostridiales bacterium]
MFQEFVVKVNRYWSDESGSQGWDGWFYSKVYAIEGNKFLVYDDGSMSAYNTEEDYCEDGFVWVDFTEAIPRCGGKGYEMRVTPYTADTPQTESQIETQNSNVISVYDGVSEAVRCAMCSNPNKSDRGCDGACSYDEKLYKRIMDAIDESRVDTPQTESTGSPIGNYRDGVGAWQTDCGWGEPNED